MCCLFVCLLVFIPVNGPLSATLPLFTLGIVLIMVKGLNGIPTFTTLHSVSYRHFSQ